MKSLLTGWRWPIWKVGVDFCRDRFIVGLLTGAMCLAFCILCIRKSQHCDIFDIFSLVCRRYIRAAHSKLILHLCYRVVLDYDNLVALLNDLLQIPDLGHKFELVVTDWLISVEVWKLFVDLFVIRENLANSIKVAPKQIFVWCKVIGLWPFARRNSWSFLSESSVHRDSACLLQILRHQLLISLKCARIRIMLHGLKMIRVVLSFNPWGSWSIELKMRVLQFTSIMSLTGRILFQNEDWTRFDVLLVWLQFRLVHVKSHKLVACTLAVVLFNACHVAFDFSWYSHWRIFSLRLFTIYKLASLLRLAPLMRKIKLCCTLVWKIIHLIYLSLWNSLLVDDLIIAVLIVLVVKFLHDWRTHCLIEWLLQRTPLQVKLSWRSTVIHATNISSWSFTRPLSQSSRWLICGQILALGTRLQETISRPS